jgi:hypothetical protein
MSDLSPLCAPKRTFANASGFIGSRPSDIRFGSGVFAPPIGPPDPVRCTSGPHDGPLIGGTESPIEAILLLMGRNALGTFLVFMAPDSS